MKPTGRGVQPAIPADGPRFARPAAEARRYAPMNKKHLTLHLHLCYLLSYRKYHLTQEVIAWAH